jgi:hypothetical protein
MLDFTPYTVYLLEKLIYSIYSLTPYPGTKSEKNIRYHNRSIKIPCCILKVKLYFIRNMVIIFKWVVTGPPTNPPNMPARIAIVMSLSLFNFKDSAVSSTSQHIIISLPCIFHIDNLILE